MLPKDKREWFKFYYDFAAAYGTLWLVGFVVAMTFQAHIDTGKFGILGFPLIALIFAFFRREYGD